MRSFIALFWYGLKTNASIIQGVVRQIKMRANALKDILKLLQELVYFRATVKNRSALVAG